MTALRNNMCEQQVAYTKLDLLNFIISEMVLVAYAVGIYGYVVYKQSFVSRLGLWQFWQLISAICLVDHNIHVELPIKTSLMHLILSRQYSQVVPMRVKYTLQFSHIRFNVNQC